MVSSFGYRKKRGGSWVKKDPAQALEDRSPSPPPQRDDSSSLMHNILDAMDARFAGMDTRITKLEEDVSFVRQCLDLPPPS